MLSSVHGGTGLTAVEEKAGRIRTVRSCLVVVTPSK